MRTTALATPITHVLVPGHTLGTPGSVQMAKIAPATTALPTQQTTVIPASTVNSGVPGVQQAATISKTILPQASLQQLQSHNVVINPGNLHQIQRPVAETGEGMASSLEKFKVLAPFLLSMLALLCTVKYFSWDSPSFSFHLKPTFDLIYYSLKILVLDYKELKFQKMALCSIISFRSICAFFSSFVTI